MTINELQHKLLQVFIFIKQSANENNIEPYKLKYNTNYRKGLKITGFTIVIESF